ncbi:MAG: hypothetical protein HY985_11630 [Magnetospirillum sp.]|nr:hypothetical protein [Magnetospirillum sp.]
MASELIEQEDIQLQVGDPVTPEAPHFHFRRRRGQKDGNPSLVCRLDVGRMRFGGNPRR